jgi:hypothetical protein
MLIRLMRALNYYTLRNEVTSAMSLIKVLLSIDKETDAALDVFKSALTECTPSLGNEIDVSLFKNGFMKLIL